MSEDPLNRIPWRLEDIVPALSWWPEAMVDGLYLPEHPEYSPDEEEDDD